MDWFPLYNSIRIAALAELIVFFAGVFAAHRAGRLPPLFRAGLDAFLTLPLVLSPSVTGWLLLRFFGPRHPLGFWLRTLFGIRLELTWQAAILPAALAAFPLMYRMARQAFARYNEDLSDAACTLGRSDAWVFWMVKLPVCWKPLLTGAVLSFARAAGEYGATAMTAGYAAGETATASTTVYFLWRSGNPDAAALWVLVNLLLSAGFLLAVGLLENDSREDRTGRPGGRAWN